MTTKDTRGIAEKFADREGVENALKQAAHQMLLTHQRAGVPVVIWRDGQVMELPAEVLLREQAEADQSAGR